MEEVTNHNRSSKLWTVKGTQGKVVEERLSREEEKSLGRLVAFLLGAVVRKDTLLKGRKGDAVCRSDEVLRKMKDLKNIVRKIGVVGNNGKGQACTISQQLAADCRQAWLSEEWELWLEVSGWCKKKKKRRQGL